MFRTRSISLSLALVAVLATSAFAEQPKNRIAVSIDDKILLYEFDPATKKFGVVWEGASTGRAPGRVTSGIVGMALTDLDTDGTFELLTQRQLRKLRRTRKIDAWKIIGEALIPLSAIELPCPISWSLRVDEKYKTVYLGFSLADILAPEARREVVKRIMAWFNRGPR